MAGIVIIDYGVGNLGSVEKAFTAVGCRAMVSADEQVLHAADRLVLPGVGAFAACLGELRSRGFDELVRAKVAAGVPLLGICVGMQLLFDSSEEFGETAGLGFFSGKVRRFPAPLRVPHVGWNTVKQQNDSNLWRGVRDEAHFYFVHSYFCDAEQAAGVTEYEGVNFTAAVVQANIWGLQFHPEKSQQAGLQLLKNFAELAG